MNANKILDVLNGIEAGVSIVRDLLFSPDGVRITAIRRDGFSYVEYWDGALKPRILFYAEEKVDAEYINYQIKEAIGMIPPSYCGNKEIELHTDLTLDEFTKGVGAGINIFSIKLEDISEDLIRHIRERHDFNDYLSRIKEAQARLAESTSACGDSGLSTIRPCS